jgi:plastocyanin
MSKKSNHLMFFSTFVFGCFLSMQSYATDYTASQKDKKFVPEKLNIKVGDSVNFVNDDNTPHNVYSESSSNHFELGMYRKGQERKVVFDKPGTVQVECLIHPGMKMTVEVTK